MGFSWPQNENKGEGKQLHSKAHHIDEIHVQQRMDLTLHFGKVWVYSLESDAIDVRLGIHSALCTVGRSVEAEVRPGGWSARSRRRRLEVIIAPRGRAGLRL